MLHYQSKSKSLIISWFIIIPVKDRSYTTLSHYSTLALNFHVVHIPYARRHPFLRRLNFAVFIMHHVIWHLVLLVEFYFVVAVLGWHFNGPCLVISAINCVESFHTLVVLALHLFKCIIPLLMPWHQHLL